MKSQSCVKLHWTRENLLILPSCPLWMIPRPRSFGKASFCFHTSEKKVNHGESVNHVLFIRADVHTVTCEFHHSGSSFNSIASTCIPSAEMLGSFRPCGWENSVSCHMLHLSAANALKKALASTFSGSGSLRSLGDATFWKAPGKTTQWVTQHFKGNFHRTEHIYLGLNQCVGVWKH